MPIKTYMKPRKYPERKVKVRVYKQRYINVSRKEVKHDYLKHLRVVRAWARFKHKISLDDFEMLCYLYSEHIFDAAKFEHYGQLFGFTRNRRLEFMNKGLISHFRKPGQGQRAIYELTAKARSIMRQVYEMLLGERPIPNMASLRDSPHHFAKRQYDRVINRINSKI